MPIATAIRTTIIDMRCVFIGAVLTQLCDVSPSALQGIFAGKPRSKNTAISPNLAA
jgi:hypothetical protein